MDWNLVAYFLPFVISVVVALGVSFYAFRHSHIIGANQYGWYVLARSVWNFGLLLEVLSLTSREKTFWLYVEASSISITLVSLAFFFISYSEFKPRKFGLVWGSLILPPALFLLLVFTNGWHGLVFRNPYFDAGNPISLLQFEFTPVAWVILIYASVMTMVFFGVLLGKFIHAQTIYRSQIVVIMLGVATDIIGVGLAVALNRRELIPPAATVGNLIVSWGLFRFRLFDLRPVARDTLFDKMEDLVIVLDAQDRIVDINPSALAELRMTASEVIGKPASLVLSEFPDWPDLLKEFRQPANKSVDFGFERDSNYHHFDIKSTLLYDRHQNYQGRIFAARDVTARARLRWQLKKLNEELTTLNQELEDRVKLRTNELAEAYDTTLQGWARALELRDKETEGHSRRVTALTLKLARALDVADPELDDIRRGALLHDIGKMAIPDEILRKTANLTPAEREIVAAHPVIAHQLLSPIKFLEKALEIPYCHHEKWDGSGYPRGLKGEEIPLSARIFSIVDVWDAVLSDRIYRKAWSLSRARAYMKKQAARYFDPRVVGVFLDLMQQGEI